MTARFLYGCIAVTLMTVLPARRAASQDLPPPTFELAAGWAAFPDESLINHAVLGAGLRMHLTPRVSVGPELTYMAGPGSDRDLFVLGDLFFDFVPARGGGSPAVAPFVVAGAGLFHHRNRFGPSTSRHNSLTFVAGGGVRVQVTDRVSIAPDVRLAAEDPHLRATVNVGVRIRR